MTFLKEEKIDHTTYLNNVLEKWQFETIKYKLDSFSLFKKSHIISLKNFLGRYYILNWGFKSDASAPL